MYSYQQCGIGISNTGKQFNGTKQKVHKQIYTYMENRFLTKVQRQFSGETTVYSADGARTIVYPYTQQVNLNPYLTLYTKINPEWITDLDVKSQRYNFWEKIQGKTLQPWIQQRYLDTRPKPTYMKVETDSPR